MPVSDVTTALPPRSSWLATRRLVAKAKHIKIMCVTAPYRAYTISRNVWHLGAFCFTLHAITVNMKICTVAPAASGGKNVVSCCCRLTECWGNSFERTYTKRAQRFRIHTPLSNSGEVSPPMSKLIPHHMPGTYSVSKAAAIRLLEVILQSSPP